MTISRENVVCIWYPTGGFGHFVSALLDSHGIGFSNPREPLEFGQEGDSHAFPLALPKYFHNPDEYIFPNIDPSKKYPVLIDNGINDESITYRKIFNNAKTIKLCYSDYTWPIIVRTMIKKAMLSDITVEITVNLDDWPVDEEWSLREKYFLHLRDNPLRHLWRPDPHCCNLLVDDLLHYPLMLEKLSNFGVGDTFYDVWVKWKAANSQYINPVETAASVLTQLENPTNVELPKVDLWTQAVTNYYIWLKYGVTVPANDYSNWFTNTKEIIKMLNDQGVVVDTN